VQEGVLAMKNKQDWSEKYSAALLETNRKRLPLRIDEARTAILDRVREIPDTSKERQKLDYAMKTLSALREAC
jgi:hypothetical protein